MKPWPWFGALVIFLSPARVSAQQLTPTGAHEEHPSLSGRVVDEDGHLVADHRLEFTLRIRTVGTSWSRGFEVTTDREGRFVFELVTQAADELTIGEPWYEKRPTLHDAAATLELSELFAPGVHEIGDVKLLVPGSRKLLRKTTDTDLETLFIMAERGHAFTSDARHDADTCLTEIIERGGPRWEKFIARHLAVSRKLQDRDFPSRDDGSHPIENVGLLTALRRLQHQPDPVLLEIDGGPLLETVFPDDPMVRYRVKNVDSQGESIALWTWELSDHGMNDYCRVDARASDGSPVKHYDERKIIGGGSASRVTIAPGATRESTVGLQYYVHLPMPGDYQVVLRQRHGHAGRDFAYSTGSVDGWIYSSSDVFTIRVLPRQIAISNAERERLLDRFRAIDFASPTLIVWQPWKAGDAFKEAATTPQDELYLAGWSAVPVLLDVLDQEPRSARECAWALALLADITGLHAPVRDDRENLAWGRYVRFNCWPGLERSRRENGDHAKPATEGPELPDLRQQDELIQRWRETRKGFVIQQ